MPTAACAYWMIITLAQGAALAAPPPAATTADTSITSSAAASLAIFLAPGSTADETHAAQELAGFLGNATVGVPLKISTTPPSSSSAQHRSSTSAHGGVITLAVGYGAATAVGLPPAWLEGLGNESFVVSSNATGLSAPGIIAVSGGKGARRGSPMRR